MISRMTQFSYATIFTIAYCICNEWYRKKIAQIIHDADKLIPNHTLSTTEKLTVKAFRDMGWKNPIYFLPNNDGVGSFTAFDNHQQRAAYVGVHRRITKQGLWPGTEVFYAWMGHEAVHCLYEHSLIGSVIRGYTWSFALFAARLALINMHTNPLAGILCSITCLAASNIPITIVGRAFEKSADLISSKRLGTAHLLIDDFKERNKSLTEFLTEQQQAIKNEGGIALFSYANTRISLLFDGHPSHAERVRYLNLLKNSQDYNPSAYKFTESAEYQEATEAMHKFRNEL